ncbi:unnamed protein product [Closterium sp. NIES-65]|nr:unnamed protein product [Closterium sp. NIES-65]
MRKRYLGKVYQGTLGAGSDMMVVQQSGSGEEWVNQIVAEALAQMRSGRDVKRGVESGVHHPDLTTMLGCGIGLDYSVLVFKYIPFPSLLSPPAHRRYAAPERLASSPTKPRSPFASSSPPAAATVVTATAGKGQGGMEAADVFAFKVVVLSPALSSSLHCPPSCPLHLLLCSILFPTPPCLFLPSLPHIFSPCSLIHPPISLITSPLSDRSPPWPGLSSPLHHVPNSRHGRSCGWRDNLAALVDPQLADEFNPHEVEGLAGLALGCTQSNPFVRDFGCLKPLLTPSAPSSLFLQVEGLAELSLRCTQ